MREIKFRAWDIQMVNMLDWDYLIDKQCTYLNSEHFHVMQFIGLFDKNGKEIYEGDIIQHYAFDKGDFFAVEWNEYNGSWQGYGAFHEWSESEVIGNVWENKELLS